MIFFELANNIVDRTGKWVVLVLMAALIGCQEKPKYSNDPEVVENGKNIFRTYCASCHDLENDQIGPKLGGVTREVDYAWIKNFIKSPRQMIESRDERAKRLFDSYQTYMPDFNFLEEEQTMAVLSYINERTESLDLKGETPPTDQPVVKKPRAQPIKESGMHIVLEDYVTIPSSSETPPLARIANMRVRPGADDEFFVNDQRGIIYRVKDRQVSTFLDIRKEVPDFKNEPGLGTGLGSFAFHPEFEKNGLIYITHVETFKGQPADYEFQDSIKVSLQWVLSEWKMDNPLDNVFKGTRREMLRVNEPSQVHGFQDMNFVPDISPDHPDYGLLYLCSGDGGCTIRKFPFLTHTLKSPLGTILRIDPMTRDSKNGKYGIPKDNPFVAAEDPQVWKEIWTYGFRNPHRLEWTSEGKLIASDVGEGSFEELNLIEPGKDYGWNVREGDHRFNPNTIRVPAVPMEEEDTVHQLPLAQFDHYNGDAVCGGYEYVGSISKLQGKYLFGDITSGNIFYIKTPVGDEVLQPIYRLDVKYNDNLTTMQVITGNSRVDLRFGENAAHDMFVMSKADAKIRLITGAAENK